MDPVTQTINWKYNSYGCCMDHRDSIFVSFDRTVQNSPTCLVKSSETPLVLRNFLLRYKRYNTTDVPVVFPGHLTDVSNLDTLITGPLLQEVCKSGLF